jgi:hypothetical protein
VFKALNQPDYNFAPTGMSATPMIGGQAGQQPMPYNINLPNGQQLDMSSGLTPQNLYNQYAGQIFGAPAQTYNPLQSAPLGMNAQTAPIAQQQLTTAQNLMAPQPMPTQATQGYQSRIAPKPMVRAPAPVAKPVARAAVKPIVKPAPVRR